MEKTVRRLQNELENAQAEPESAHTELEGTCEEVTQLEFERTTEAELDKLRAIESLNGHGPKTSKERASWPNIESEDKSC